MYPERMMTVKNEIGEKLNSLRSACGLSQKRVAELLRAKGIYVTNQAVSKWETNLTQPNAEQFLALCSIYGVEDVMAEFTGTEPHTEKASLNAEGRKKADEYVGLLIASGLYREHHAEMPPVLRTIPIFRLAASAGTGQFLDSDDCDYVEADPSVPGNADFGVRIAGDSMTPRFTDGQIVWVHGQETLENGEIGVFLYGGDAYCKRFERADGAVRLVSLNTAYKPITVNPEMDLRVFGKVVGG